MWDLLEVEVEENGKKKPLSNARLYLWIDGKIHYGPGMFGEMYKESKFAATLGKWYDKLLSRDQDQYFDQLYYRLWGLHAILKKYFDMQAKKHPYKGYLGEN
ncbi:TPA: hypothetical protein HA234_06225 [Candidatus Woesearchaeota archaeon]|nr:hypothetical protein [Candidatus Woesearchaeota archaeon]